MLLIECCLFERFCSLEAKKVTTVDVRVCHILYVTKDVNMIANMTLDYGVQSPTVMLK